MTEFKPTFLKPSETSSLLDRDNSIEHTNFVYNRFISQSIHTQRQRLPIFKNRNHILYLLEKFQTLVLVGETGSGKSTQIPQYLFEAEWPLQIGICEPRRTAAISLAQRVADETGTIVQRDTVGYAVRFDCCISKPKIKYMTEGILLREMMSDPLLTSYSVIMIDEVHERSLYTDILMGLMKKVLQKRPELRLIVASATLDASAMQKFFNNTTGDNSKLNTSVIMSVEGRQFSVEIYYVNEPVPCYMKSSVELAIRINAKEQPGDILIFLTGQEEVDKTVRLLLEHADDLEQSKAKNKIMVLPIYGSLPYYQQLKVFKKTPDGYRKIIVATNIAETSITIPGIVYIIDCGFVKVKWYNIETHTDTLTVLPISRSSADQRAGRAGRMRTGKVFRLYTEEWSRKLALTTPPEMYKSYGPSKTIQRQIAEIVQIALDFCLLLLQIIYYNIESIYRTFRSIKPAPVKDKVILVTGAGHGIGRELALQYASQGSVLVLWDINKANNEETSRIIKKNGCHNVHTYTVDVAERNAVQKMAKLVEEEVGDVSILINNAGIMPAHPLEQHTEEEIKRIMNINVLAHFWTIEAFLPTMKRNNDGHIVALSSIAGLAGLPNLVPYCASKFAVRGLMEALLEELNENPYNKIKTTTVCPFMVNTGLCKKPYVRFENALNLLQPAFVAQQIMHAQRIGLNEFTIPKFLMTVTNITRLFPVKVGKRVKKFFESGVYSDL